MDKSLDHVVTGAADGDQPFAGMVYCLVVGGVYPDAVSVELIKEITSAKITVKDIVELIAADPPVGLGGVDMLRDVAAEMDVDELQSFADAEDRFSIRDEAGQGFQL